MKRLFFLFVLMFVCAYAHADFKLDGINYYTIDSQTCRVSSVSTEITGSLVIPNVAKGYRVTQIGEMAFNGCTGLTSILIPSSVTSIDQKAFMGCPDLTSIKVESKNPKYDSRNNCNAIIETKTNKLIRGCQNTFIPEEVTSIEFYAFMGCTGLTSISIPKGVKYFETAAFHGCSTLRNINIPECVTFLGSNAFSGCNSLKSITLPSSLTKIWYNVFVENQAINDITCLATTPPSLADGQVAPRYTKCTLHVLPGCGKTYRTTAGWSQFNKIIEDAVDPKQILIYTSTESDVIEPTSLEAFGANIISNTYENEQGKIVFDGTITKIGEMAFAGCSTLMDITIPSEVTEIEISAFTDCYNLKKITITGNHVYDSRNNCNAIIETKSNTLLKGCASTIIPNSVTTIGPSAFKDCYTLTHITIPSEVSSIEDGAFSGCFSLNDVTNLASVPQTIDPNVFEVKRNLHVLANCVDIYHTTDVWKDFKHCFDDVTENNVIYYTSNNHIIVTPNKGSSFGANLLNNTYENGRGKLVFDGNVTEIGDNAFSGNSVLTSINIPASVTRIGDAAFSGCPLLEYIDIPSNVATIGKYAFRGCKHLKSVTIPNSITTIGDKAFEKCYDLYHITIPRSVSSFGSMVFEGCDNLLDITNLSTTPQVLKNDIFSRKEILHVLPGCGVFYRTLKIWGDFKYILEDIEDPNRVIYYTSSDGKIVTPASSASFGANILCNIYENGQGKIIFDDNVILIGANAFKGCSNLVSITIPEPVISIEKWAFAECSKLEDITLSNGLSKIGAAAFYGCSKLSNIIIPSNVTKIGANAFAGCTNLQNVTNHATTPQSINSDVFAIKHLLNVDLGNKTAYQASNGWNEFATILEYGDVNEAPNISNTIIYYTTSDGKIADPYYPTYVYGGASVISNTYEKGQGKLIFDRVITKIGSEAFMRCSTITSISIPKTVTEIGKGAFAGCTGLTSITIPSSVKKIRSEAFSRCNNLLSVTNLSPIPQVGWTDYDDLLPANIHPCFSVQETLHVMAGCGDAYRATNGWKGFKHIIEDVPIQDDYVIYYTTSDNKPITRFDPSACDAIIVSNTYENGQGKLVLDRGITQIGEAAFLNCTNLTSIAIPNDVTKIGDGAFEGCLKLRTITLPNSITSIGKFAFLHCALTEITIPSNVASIGDYAFGGNNITNIFNLAEIPQKIASNVFDKKNTLHVVSGCGDAYRAAIGWKDFKPIIEDIIDPNVAIYYTTSDGTLIEPDLSGNFGANLVSNTYENGQGILVFDGDVFFIGDKAFADCTKLTSITIPEFVSKIGASAFSGCTSLSTFNIPNRVTRIDGWAFAECTGLTNVTIPSCLTKIGDGVFYGCTGLTNISIPNRVTSIGASSFSGCTGLTNITIPNQVLSIGGWAFSDCTGLKNISIPSSVIRIGDGAFDHCSGLSGIMVDPNNYIYDSRNNCNAVIETASNTLIRGCQNTIIPNEISSIGYRAFSGCTGLTCISIPSNVASIEECAFKGCSDLTEISIPNNVASIKDYTFSDCIRLETLTIPSKVSSIGDYAFEKCDALSDVTNFATNPQPISNNVFAVKRRLHVLPGLGDSYRVASIWKDFNSIIEDAAVYTIADGTAYTNTRLIQSANVEYTRNFNNTNWQALYIPFSLPYDAVKEDLELAWLNDTHMYDDDNDGTPDRCTLEFFVMSDGETEPNTPYLVRAKNADSYSVTIHNVNVYPAETPAFECSTFKQTFTVRGTYTGVTGTEMMANHYYAPVNGQLKYALNENASLKPQRWYLSMVNKDGSTISNYATSIRMTIDGELIDETETGFTSIREMEEDSIYYSIDGRAIVGSPVQPGIYINNNKKIILK